MKNLKMILILTSGENVTVGLLSAILKKEILNQQLYLDGKLPIITDQNHQKAKILNIDKKRVNNFLKEYDVISISGFSRNKS